jgi:CYTH domain-containing protein
VGVEIERKFLLRGDAWRAVAARRVVLRDGLLLNWRGRKLRVRLSAEDASIAFKGRRRGVSRREIEVAMPRTVAAALIFLSRNAVTKTRHFVPHARWTWHVDEFHGALAGVVLADVELGHAAEIPTLPDWIGREVTGRPEYRKSRLLAERRRLR